MNPGQDITEADLHSYVDGKLVRERQQEVEEWLAHRPEAAMRVAAYRAQKRELRSMFDPVLDEALPSRLVRTALPKPRWNLQRLVAGVAIAVVSGTAGWDLRGGSPVAPETGSIAQQTWHAITMASATGFAKRAAVAHAVYSPDERRPVEVDAAHEEQLIAWLSKRMGTPMKPPHLQSMGYALEGGRLLPGGEGPVAQFMYRDDAGKKLTLYVSTEVGDLGGAGGGANGTRGKNAEVAFRFAQEAGVNVFYWVDGTFGYAISAGADRAALASVSGEVYRQLTQVPR